MTHESIPDSPTDPLPQLRCAACGRSVLDDPDRTCPFLRVLDPVPPAATTDPPTRPTPAAPSAAIAGVIELLRSSGVEPPDWLTR